MLTMAGPSGPTTGRGSSFVRESFDFLGFTRVCGKTRKGRLAVLRRTSRKRMRRKLGEVKTELKRRVHVPVPEVGKWLGRVLRGHFNYHGVPQNSAALNTFRYYVSWLWWRALRRRSQKTRLTWERMRRLVERYPPLVRITHPYPSVQFRLNT
jgi:hypothetical protein